MAQMDDPFRHHPGLRDLVIDPMMSPLRGFDPASLDDRMKERGLSSDWRLTAEAREADRQAAMARRPEGPLWVYGYGSLMWDPAIRFCELRRAFAPRHARRMILRDIWGGRGTVEVPGLMAALDTGTGCHGLVFRLDEADLDQETRYLFARERAGPAYQPVFIPVETDQGPVAALTFVADHASPIIVADLPREKMVEHLALGEGWLGTSIDYGRNMVRHLGELAIPDPDLARLVADAEDFRRTHAAHGDRTCTGAGGPLEGA